MKIYFCTKIQRKIDALKFQFFIAETKIRSYIFPLCVPDLKKSVYLCG